MTFSTLFTPGRRTLLAAALLASLALAASLGVAGFGQRLPRAHRARLPARQPDHDGEQHDEWQDAGEQSDPWVRSLRIRLVRDVRVA